MSANVPVSMVVIEDRMRKEMGDIENLAISIKENGLINPITLAPDVAGARLVAGHRRLQALVKLGISDLVWGEHYLWRQDLQDDEYRRIAVEIEENIKRKALIWSEEVLGKQKLLETYERIYGSAGKGGKPARAVQQGLKPAGFGVRKLAELLNEAPSTTSQDLEMAALIKQFPVLRNEPSMDAAKRKLELAIRIHANQGVAPVAKPLVYKILVECDGEQHQLELLERFKGEGLKCSPIVA